MKILYNDKDICVCVKPVGVDSESEFPKLLEGELGESVYPVHRLDKAVGGVMVYAKTKEAAGVLSREVSERKIIKEYFCVVSGKPLKDEDILEDLLYRDKAKGKTYVVDRMRKGVKDAKLEYKVCESKVTDAGTISLLRVKLYTGRTHQIRVQFASRKLPLLGDRRYGGDKSVKDIALFSARLAFCHPITNEPLDFNELPEKVFPWNEFRLERVE